MSGSAMPCGQASDATRRLFRAAVCGDIKGVEEALRDGGVPDEEPQILGTAASVGYAGIVDLLLEAGGSVHARGPFDHTALYEAGLCGSPTIAQRLIDAGADVFARTFHGHTALHGFAEQGHTAGARVLLEAGAEVDAVNNYCDTPLTKAVRNRRTSTVALLLEAGAGHGWRDKDGRQALHLAAQNGDLDVATLLIQAGADVNDAALDRGYAPLHLAVSYGGAALTRFLLRAGAHVLACDFERATPLCFAVGSGPAEVVVEILGFLERQGDNMLVPSSALALEEHKGRTPLYFAVANGRLRIVDMLLHRGALETHRDRAGNTPSSFAREWIVAPIRTPGKVKRETEVTSEEEQRANALLRSLARGPAFRARSLLWPRSMPEEDRSSRSWKVSRICARRVGQKKPVSFMAVVSRYINKSTSLDHPEFCRW